jgi:phosphotransferase system HPr-like phosphotransfer protein
MKLTVKIGNLIEISVEGTEQEVFNTLEKVFKAIKDIMPNLLAMKVLKP